MFYAIIAVLAYLPTSSSIPFSSHYLGHRARSRFLPRARMARAALGTDQGCHRQHRSRHAHSDRA